MLQPRPGTFFSRDVLNPDVLRVGKSYWMYFSGNSAATDAGSWQTGLAVADSPRGPFRIRPRVQLDFVNGSTTRAGHWFYHGASDSRSGRPWLYRSRDGRRWLPLTAVPEPPGPVWDLWRSDLYLFPRRRGLRIYYAGRPGPAGADLGLLRYRDDRFTTGSPILGRSGGWDGLDLGGPAFFRARGRDYLLYAGLQASGTPRRIGLAYRSSGGWRRCSGPFIDVSSRYPGNAIDPEPVVHRGRLYLYFGGGVNASLGGNMEGTIWVRVYRLSG